MKALWKRTNGGSPGTRVFAAYVALVMMVAIIGPGLSVYAADGDETLVPPAEESVAGVEIPSAEEAVVPAPEPQELEPPADAPEVTSAASSVPTPEVFPAAVVSSAVDPVLSDDSNPGLTAGGVRINAPTTGTYTADDVEDLKEPVPADFALELQVFEQSGGWYLSFSSNYRITQVVMKGGTGGANLYTYGTPGVFSDSFLHCPVNPSGTWAGVSHVDFYFAPVPTVGCVTANKFRDDNRNQIWDSEEPALEGWLMTLRDSSGAVVGSGTTGSDGSIRFYPLAPGEYTVTETLQSGWENTTPLVRSATVVAGQRTCVYFGNVPTIVETGDLTVYKFWDASDDGEYDDGELMLGGWLFTLYDSENNVVASGRTGVDGSIAFNDLEPGDYHVTETLLADWRATTALTQNATIETGDDDELWFGNIPAPEEPEQGSLKVYKYEDLNKNEQHDEGEPMLEDWHFDVTLESPPISPFVGHGETDDDGELLFEELDPGLVYVTETMQEGWTNTTPVKQSITIVAGQTVELWFGNVREAPETGTLIIHKFEDDNEDENWDDGEAMLQGWEFTVINPAGPVVNSIQPAVAMIGSGTTNAEGELIFTDLPPMTVRVTETMQSGWTNTTALTQDAEIVAGQTTHVWFGNIQFLRFTELDLAITKVADDRTVDEGQLVTYTLTYWNLMSDEDAYDYTIVDDYDERYMTIVNANGGTVADGKISWKFAGPLTQAMGKQTLTYTARVSADMPDKTTYIDNVVVIDDDRDFNPKNNRDDERIVYDPDDPYLPFTGGEYLLLVIIAVAASVVGLVLRLKPQAS